MVLLDKTDNSGSTSIIDNSEISSSINVYPNPTNGIINIDATEINKIEVIDTKGCTKYTGKANQINISDFKKGIYFIKISTKNGFDVKKIILN